MSKKAKKVLTPEELKIKKEEFEKQLEEALEKFNAMSLEEKLVYCHCWKHTGKMENIVSMSTSSKQNPFCIARIEDAKKVFAETGKEIVCLHCFSESMQEQYDTMYIKYIIATEFLTQAVYPVKAFTLLNAAISRLESFGDINPEEAGGVNQGLNYIHNCKRNPETMFACWTKNPEVWKKVFQIEKKPRNLIMIYSDPVINGSMENPEELLFAIKCVYPFIDKIFIVYDKNRSKLVNINCGARSCNTCRRCYRKRSENIIKEELK